MRLLRPLVLTGCVGLLASCSSVGPVEDLNPPLVAFVVPAAGATVGRSVTIEVGAVDDDAVDRVVLRIDGDSLTTLFTPPYRATWNAGSVVDGSQHVIKAEAIDFAKNKGAAQITVTVTSGGN